MGDMSFLPIYLFNQSFVYISMVYGNPFQYSCLENPWTEEPGAGYCPWGRKELDTTERFQFTSWIFITYFGL